VIIKMAPHRRVVDNVITSHGLPDIKIEVSPDFRFLGELKFTLLDAARVEAFLFVEEDEVHQIKRLFIAQFEAYLPDNNYTYQYPEMDRVRLGDHDYMTDGGVLILERVVKRRPEGDIAEWVRWMQTQGFDHHRWNELAYRRFVRVVDRVQRSELLLLYFENLRTRAVKADDLLTCGHSDPRVSELETQVHASALKSFAIVQG
jgi:hypothetical protein